MTEGPAGVLLWLTALALMAEMLFTIKQCCEQIIANVQSHFGNDDIIKEGENIHQKAKSGKDWRFLQIDFVK